MGPRYQLSFTWGHTDGNRCLVTPQGFCSNATWQILPNYKAVVTIATLMFFGNKALDIKANNLKRTWFLNHHNPYWKMLHSTHYSTVCPWGSNFQQINIVLTRLWLSQCSNLGCVCHPLNLYHGISIVLIWLSKWRNVTTLMEFY